MSCNQVNQTGTIQPGGRTRRRRLAVVALALLVTACGHRPAAVVAAPVDEAALESAWGATLTDLRAQLENGRYDAADSDLANFAQRYAGTPQASQALFWRAVVALDPANRTATPRDAMVAVDAYLAGGRSQPLYDAALVLRRTATTLETLRRPVVVAAPPAPPADSSDRIKAAEEIQRLRAELEKTQAELDRIKKRIRP